MPALALALCDAGFTEHLVPLIPADGTLSPASRVDPRAQAKTPGRRNSQGLWSGLPGWQLYQTTRSDVETWAASGAGLGLRTKHHPSIDVDVDDAEVVSAIEAALNGVLGAGFLRRVRNNAPRFAVPCRLPRDVAPFRKSVLAIRRTDALDAPPIGKVEIPGDGEQIAIVGRHTSGTPLEWSNGTQRGGAELLVARAAAGLPELSPATIEERLLPALREALQPLGLIVGQVGGGTSSVRSNVDQTAHLAPSVAAVREIVDRIPNDADWDERVSRLAMGYAIKAAVGPEHDADGLEIWCGWRQRKYDGGEPPQCFEYIERQWRTLRPPFSIGYHWLVDHARRYGYDSAGDDFDVVPGATAPLPPPPPLPTEGERLAALTGDADRVALLELSGLRGPLDEIQRDRTLKRLLTLADAARTRDPLADVYLREVLPAVGGCGAPADDERRFCAFLRARLAPRDGAALQFTSLSPTEQQLLLRAAYVQRAEVARLSEGVRDAAPPRIPHQRRPASEELLDGALGRGGLMFTTGHPGGGKTWEALELACAVALPPCADQLGVDEPRTYLGRRVEHGSVAYLAAEDAAGVAARVFDRGEGVPNLHIFAGCPDLASPTALLRFLADVVRDLPADSPPLRLVVVDTLNMASSADENSNTEMASVLRNLVIAGRVFGVAFDVLHHPPKSATGDSATSALRGASAILGAADFVLWVERDADASGLVITSRALKQKRAELPLERRARLDGGRLVDEPAESSAAVEQRLGRRRAVCFTAAVRSFPESGSGVPFADVWATCQERWPKLFKSRDRNAGNAARIAAEKEGWIAKGARRGDWKLGAATGDVALNDLGSLCDLESR